MPRSQFHEQLVQYAIAAGSMPLDRPKADRNNTLQHHTGQVTEQDEPQLYHTTTPRPLWLRTRRSQFSILQPKGGFTPADLVFRIEPPLESLHQAECRPPADARWEGSSTIDLSMFRHYSNPERFDRHLRRLHELVGTRKVITAGEQYRDPKRCRLMGQTYISNLFGMYEVEEWVDEHTRKVQVEWSQWILDVLYADRRDQRLPRCPLGARKVLNHAIADVLSETEPRKKRRYQRMLEGTRLETAILQAVGLKAVARTCCVRKMTSSGEDASFEEVLYEDSSAVSGEDMLDRYRSFLKHRRIGQAFDDAEVIATAMRRKKTAWKRFRRCSGLEFPKLEVIFPDPEVIARSSGGLPYVPARPSGLRQSIVRPSSVSSRVGRKPAIRRKPKPRRTIAILRQWFGVDVAQAMLEASCCNLQAVPPKLDKLGARVTVGGRSPRMTRPETSTSALQSTGVAVNSVEKIAQDGPRGKKRPLSEVSATPESAQEGIKRVRIRDEKRRSSTLLSSSPSAGSAEEGIVAAQAENIRRRSSSLFSSSPSTGEPSNHGSDTQTEKGRTIPAQGAVQAAAPQQSEVQHSGHRPVVTRMQQPRMQQARGSVGVGTLLRPPGRQYRPQTKDIQGMHGQRPPSAQQSHERPRSTGPPRSSLQHPAATLSQVLRHLPLQEQPHAHPRASNNPTPQQSMIPHLAARAREDYWRRISMVPDAAQRLHEQTAAHGQAAVAEVNRHYQLIHQLLTTLGPSQMQQPSRSMERLEHI